MAKRWAWVAVGVFVAGAWAACTDDDSGQAPASSVTTPQPTVSTSASPSPGSTTKKPWYDDYDPAHFAADVRRYAKQAGVNPQLLMAILYNESYKPHDPKFERQWAEVDSDPAFGIANMHKPAFDQTKRGRPFAKRRWEELPDDPALAIQAAAWHLHDLAKRLPANRAELYTKDELLALGYNAGGGNMRIFARGRKAGPQAQSYLDRLHSNWAKSADALKN
ncbi:transglycosylase SLT domain-containing protein [Kribbella sp. NPDC048915]|uniref:transglycosylase SLT domain-containing protein n=1 Tax=Kribbella sp. NPDC048915 TaxID=3155148 RepID=UPI0033D83376